MPVPAPILVLSGFLLGALLMRSIVSGWIRRIVARERPFRAIADAALAMLRIGVRIALQPTNAIERAPLELAHLSK